MADELKLAADNMRTAVRTSIRRRRFLYFIQAIALIVAAIAALFYPLFTAVALASLVGWVLVASGVFQGISLVSAQNTPNFWLQAVSAALSVIVGLMIATNPGVGIFAISALLVVFFAVEGIAKIIFSLSIRPLPNWGLVLLSGLVALALAGILWAYMPMGSAWIVSVFLGIVLLAEGLALGAMALGAGRISRAAEEAMGELRGEELRTREH